MTFDYEQYVKDQTVSELIIQRLRACLEKRNRTILEIEEIEKRVKSKKATLREYEESILPDIIAQCETKDDKLTVDDISLSVAQDVHVNIKKDDMLDACSWLEDKELTDKIKTRLIIETADKKTLNQSKLLLRKIGLKFIQEKFIHPLTLKSTVNKNIGKIKFPDLFTVFISRKAKIRKRKKNNE
jgi:hypothetical protein